MFAQFQQMGLVQKNGEKWELTDAGKQRGGKYISSQKYGTWIAWPRDVIKVETGSPDGEAKPLAEVTKEQHLSATALGRTFGLPATRMNYVLSELGWIQKSLKGWKVTQQGAAVGGIQREDTRSGIPFVAWPGSIATKAVYAKYGFNIIDLNDEDVHNLDDILPAKLLKFGVQAY